MKAVYILIIFSLSNPAWSGDGSYVYDSKDYDQSTGLLIIPIVAFIEKKNLSSYEHQGSKNLFLYNPSTKSSRKAFEKYYGEITGYLLESALSKDGNEIDYLGMLNMVKNNQAIKARPLKPTMLIESYNNTIETYTVWRMEKLSGKPGPLFNYKKPASWHVDAKTGIIRLIQQSNDHIDVKEYMW